MRKLFPMPRYSARFKNGDCRVACAHKFRDNCTRKFK